MMRVRLSARAERDLLEILLYVSQDSPRLAVGLVDRIEKAAQELADTARRYPIIARRRDSDLRRRPVRPYVILYSVASDQVNVLRIVHGVRDLDAVLRGLD